MFIQMPNNNARTITLPIGNKGRINNMSWRVRTTPRKQINCNEENGIEDEKMKIMATVLAVVMV